MKNSKLIILNSVIIAGLTLIATSVAIFMNGGQGEYTYKTIRGYDVQIYGQGLYKDMSSDVAIQGIAQDYVTLFIAVPLLLIALYVANKGSLSGKMILSGVLLYLTLNYLFYTAMAMYNMLFLVYVANLGFCLYTLIVTLQNFDLKIIGNLFNNSKSIIQNANFLIINGTLIALLWLSVIIPPLMNGPIVPVEVQHYTTLIVQGFDLGIFLPMAFIVAIMTKKKSSYGYLFTVIYTVFLSLLMLALVSKIIFMASYGVNVIPAIFIMPTILITAAYFVFKNISIAKKGI